ncbi:MAG: type II and III secretion system protein [Elusimicrobiota bacterium]
MTKFKTALFLSTLFILILISHPLYPAAEMVEISVEITEVNNDKANELGIKWVDTLAAGEVAGSADKRSPESLPEVPSLVQAGDIKRFSALTAELKILIQKGAAKVLSKPKITTKSGTSASFLVGGEIPIVSAGATGGGSVDWKKYGIKCDVSPVVSGDFIDFGLVTEVSRLDWSNQVKENPAILTRTASSHVRVKSGQTITLAGLVETAKQEQIIGIPLLCDIPILGYLFSRKKMVENKTTVLIFVTPRILE